MTLALKLHPGLSTSSRLRRLARTDEEISAAEWAALVGIGIVTAASSTLLNLHLRIPGHAILKVVFPIAAGLALVPRRGAGSIIGVSALITVVSLRLGGFGGAGLGFGALTSLTVIGPLLDWTLRRARSSRSLYLGFILAGLAGNLLALLVRGTLKGLGWEHAGGRPLSVWLSQAVITYTLCGMVAGLLSAFVWFCARPGTRSNDSEPVA